MEGVIDSLGRVGRKRGGHNVKWTPLLIDKLRKLANEPNATYRSIAKELGTGRHAISLKMESLGLKTLRQVKYNSYKHVPRAHRRITDHSRKHNEALVIRLKLRYANDPRIKIAIDPETLEIHSNISEFYTHPVVKM